MHHLFTRRRLITLAASSFSLFVFSIVLAFVILPIIIDSQIDKNVRLERGTDQWDRFKQLPFNVSFNITLFAVDNVEDVIHLGAKPVLREQGPYVFDEIMSRNNLTYNDNNTVTHERKLEYHFNQTRSGTGVSIDDTITMINPVYVSLMQVLKDIGKGSFHDRMDKCMNKMFNNTPYILKDYPVRKLMFDGIKICDFKESQCNTFVVVSLCSFFAITKTIEEVKEGNEHYMKFSLFNYKEKIPDGVYEINTGMEDIMKVGEIERWNFANRTQLWNKNLRNDACNEIKGSDGTLYPPHMSEVDELEIYSTDICRSVSIYRDGTRNYKGIEGYMYKTKPTQFYSSLNNPEEDCYCSLIGGTRDEQDQPSCFLDGVIDIYPCLGLPVLVSSPHFLNANPKYLQNLSGDIEPNTEKHEIFVLLDKYTGIPLQAHKRVQLSIILRPSELFPSSKAYARTILPFCWIDEGLDLPESGMELLNSLLYDTLNLVDILKWVFIGITFCLTVFSSVLLGLHLYSS